MIFELVLLKDEWNSINRNETEKVILGTGSKMNITKDVGN